MLARSVRGARARVAAALARCSPCLARRRPRRRRAGRIPRVLHRVPARPTEARGADRREPPLESGVLDRRAREQLSLGLSSAAQGRYDPIQALLDITQGTRVSLAAYKPKRPPR